MKRHVAYRVTCGFAVGALASAVAVACSSSTSPHHGTPCPTYSGGTATPDALQGDYNLVSFCQDTLPIAQGVTGTLTMTAVPPDSFKALISIPGQLPLPLAGPYSLSHDTITVNLGFLGTFIGTYSFSGTVLSVSGKLPDNTPIAIVFGP